MANVIAPHHPQFGFNPSVTHSPLPAAPSPVIMAGWNPLHHSATHHASPARVQKRRMDPEDDEDTGRRDISMDRSPTPERTKRGPPKRLRTVPSSEPAGRDEKDTKENKAPGNDIDIGVLLGGFVSIEILCLRLRIHSATLPPQSLLPILASLINAQPSLKTAVLDLIPRPTVDMAVQAIAQSAKKLKDAYPYSNASSFASTSTTSFGFGSASSTRSSAFGHSTSGFGRTSSNMPGQGSSSNGQNGGMRDEYIVSRLRPHISDFVSACFSYLPYFSYVAPQNLASTSQPQNKTHASDAFTFLHALTTHILSQPPLTQASLVPALLPRLQAEWKAWVKEIDEILNVQGGMFGGETVKGWEKGLDQFAHAKGHGLEVFRDIRDTWVNKVGWLVGRRTEYRMEEEL